MNQLYLYQKLHVFNLSVKYLWSQKESDSWRVSIPAFCIFIWTKIAEHFRDYPNKVKIGQATKYLQTILPIETRYLVFIFLQTHFLTLKVISKHVNHYNTNNSSYQALQFPLQSIPSTFEIHFKHDCKSIISSIYAHRISFANNFALVSPSRQLVR